MDSDFYKNRVLIGRIIEKYIKERSITKSDLCEKANISRPTLNKMLSGKVTNKKTFETHREKIFSIININPDKILENKSFLFTERLNQFFSGQLSVKHIAKESGISEDRINKWLEGNGELPSSDELSNLAYVLGTSGRQLTNDSWFTFDTTLDDFTFHNDITPNKDLSISGYWGHIAIQLPGKERMQVFPISHKTYLNCYSKLQTNKYVCFPTLNNRFVMINQDNIDSIVFLDDACDEYDNAEITPKEYMWPQEVYVSLEKYLFEDRDKITPKLLKIIEDMKTNYGWNEDTFLDMTERVFIILKSGRNMTIHPFDYHDLTSSIELDYYNELEEDSTIIIYGQYGEELFINKQNISLLDTPLLKIEYSLEESYKDEQEL